MTSFFKESGSREEFLKERGLIYTIVEHARQLCGAEGFDVVNIDDHFMAVAQGYLDAGLELDPKDQKRYSKIVEARAPKAS